MPFTGSLSLKIVEAAELKPTQLSVRHSLKNPQSMLIDPFVNIAVDDSTLEKTTAKSRTFKPVWNESFSMELIESKTLQLTVFHKSAFPTDDFVANCSLPFEDIFSEEYHQTGSMEAELWVTHLILDCLPH